MFPWETWNSRQPWWTLKSAVYVVIRVRSREITAGPGSPGSPSVSTNSPGTLSWPAKPGMPGFPGIEMYQYGKRLGQVLTWRTHNARSSRRTLTTGISWLARRSRWSRNTFRALLPCRTGWRLWTFKAELLNKQYSCAKQPRHSPVADYYSMDLPRRRLLAQAVPLLRLVRLCRRHRAVQEDLEAIHRSHSRPVVPVLCDGALASSSPIGPEMFHVLLDHILSAHRFLVTTSVLVISLRMFVDRVLQYSTSLCISDCTYCTWP